MGAFAFFAGGGHTNSKNILIKLLDKIFYTFYSVVLVMKGVSGASLVNFWCTVQY